jgi:hypothetical protein
MADTKITALAAIATVDPAADVLPIVDISDTSMAASGTTKKITTNQILGSGGTATLASATITGDLTVDTSTLKVTASTDTVTVGATTTDSKFRVIDANYNGLRIGFLPGTSNYNLYDATVHEFRTANVTPQQLYTFQASSAVWFDGAGGTRMTLNSTGLGIGVTPSAWSNPYRCVQLSGGSLSVYPTTDLYISQNAYNSGGWKRVAAGYASQYIQTNSEHRFLVAGTDPTVDSAIAFTQAMTLNASGNLLVGTTSNLHTTQGFKILASGRFFGVMASGGYAIMNHTSGAGTEYIYEFQRANVAVGSITTTTTSTAYVTSSDYRLKEFVKPLTGGLARVSALKPSTYKWKSNSLDGEGFIAHELSEVVPSAVSGDKDATNEDGSIKPQGVDLSKLVPILVAAIQELTARVQTLEAR